MHDEARRVAPVRQRQPRRRISGASSARSFARPVRSSFSMVGLTQSAPCANVLASRGTHHAEGNTPFFTSLYSALCKWSTVPGNAVRTCGLSQICAALSVSVRERMDEMHVGLRDMISCAIPKNLSRCLWINSSNTCSWPRRDFMSNRPFASKCERCYGLVESHAVERAAVRLVRLLAHVCSAARWCAVESLILAPEEVLSPCA
jgi:hypothetical protein